jgi:DNA-binding NarL/FixJ family response regulator
MTLPEPPRIRVVVVDDQELVRTGFRMILESEDDLVVVGEANDGEQALDVIAASRPDVVLMDIRMPRLDGVEATRRLGSNGPRVIILTTFDLDEYVFAAIQGGANGFLLKDTPADELVAAIRVVASGDALLAPSVTQRLIERFRAAAPPATTPHPGIGQLTDREREVLIEMARGRSNTEIGDVLYVGETTVKTHVGRVLSKLGVRDRVQAVVIAYESGLVTPGSS